jgi:two-component system NtrC family sensor kinase
VRRLLKLRTWGLRGTTAAETSLVLVAATLLVPLLLFIGAAWVAYDDTQRQAEERMARTLDLLYVNVRTTFETDYLVVANIAEMVDDYTNEEIKANEPKIHERLSRLVDALPQIQNAFVIDAEGRALVSAKTFPLPAGATATDRSYFIAHRDGGQERHVSEALRGRLNDSAFFQYSERRQTPDGKFNGVIAVSISPAYFVDRFAQASEARNYTAALVRADGEILAR